VYGVYNILLYTYVHVLVLISNFFHRHRNTQNNTLSFGSKLLPSSGEPANPKTQLTKKCNTQVNIVHTRDARNQYV